GGPAHPVPQRDRSGHLDRLARARARRRGPGRRLLPRRLHRPAAPRTPTAGQGTGGVPRTRHANSRTRPARPHHLGEALKHNQLNSMTNALKPAMVDELANAAYERRPDTSLVRARTGTAPVSRGLVPGRRPVRRLAFATGATAVVAATAVLATGVLSGGH